MGLDSETDVREMRCECVSLDSGW